MRLLSNHPVYRWRGGGVRKSFSYGRLVTAGAVSEHTAFSFGRGGVLFIAVFLTSHNLHAQDSSHDKTITQYVGT
jgi:hypothetical protein